MSELTPWTVYWITRLDAVQGLSVSFLLLTFFAALLAAVLSEGDFLAVAKHFKKTTAAILSVFTLSFGAACLVPSTQEMCAILVIPKLAANEDLTGLGSEVVGFAHAWLKEDAR